MFLPKNAESRKMFLDSYESAPGYIIINLDDTNANTYGAHMKKTVVFTTTPQMHCEACENKIKSNLRFEKFGYKARILKDGEKMEKNTREKCNLT